MSYSSGNDSVQGLKNESWISGMLWVIPCYTWWNNTNKYGDFSYVKFRLHSPTKLHYCWRCFKCFLFCSLDEIWVWKGLFCAFLCVRFLFLCLIAWRMVVGFCRYNVSTSQCKYSRVTYSYGSISVWSTLSSCASRVFVPVLYFAFWQTILSDIVWTLLWTSPSVPPFRPQFVLDFAHIFLLVLLDHVSRWIWSWNICSRQHQELHFRFLKLSEQFEAQG